MIITRKGCFGSCSNAAVTQKNIGAVWINNEKHSLTTLSAGHGVHTTLSSLRDSTTASTVMGN